jgi:preprotein translocase subunit SecY
MQQVESRPKLLQALFDAFSLPDLRSRILFTLGILVVFRFIAHVPLPGVDITALNKLFDNNQLLGMLDFFSGGAMRNFSVAAMGVYPYITSTIIMQLLQPIIPQLRSLAEEGEAGRNRINQISHWMTVPLAALQGYAQITLLRSQGIVTQAGVLETITMIVAMTAGTMFLIWLGELITERGIGNGISILIFAGIVSGLPELVGRGMLASNQIGGIIVFAILGAATIYCIVVFTQAARRIPVQYAKSVFRSGRMYRQSGSSFIPLRVNTAGMIPLIFSMSLVILPSTIASYFVAPAGADENLANWIVKIFSPNTSLPLGSVYWVLYFALTMAFTFFYTFVMFEQMNLPKTLQSQGGFVPGVRPGKPTEEYLSNVIKNITWAGALFLSVIAILPFFAQIITGVQVLALSSTGLLIVVGVALDTMKQIEAQLLMRRYEGFLK